MMTNRQLFLQHVAQTSGEPLGLEITKAKGIELWDQSGKKYLDIVSGVSVCNVGHSHPAVVKAVQEQVEKYMHLTVYGEFVESPQVLYAKALVDVLPESLNSVYFTNSGAEAVEGAMKLAKRATGRMEMVAFEKGYHGSTQGALSVIGSEYWRNAYRPLLPGISHIRFGNETDLERITDRTAGVIVETIQAEAGVVIPEKEWALALRKRCTETGALLILDEVQCGLGRNGTMWGFEQFDIVPDILILAKSLGGGMPLGAFIADRELMQSFTHHPRLGHITTFGGHPVSCAAGGAAFQVLQKEKLIPQVFRKEQLFRDRLQHPSIREIRSRGLLMGVEFETAEINQKVMRQCLERGLVIDFFLYSPATFRITPPLTITEGEIHQVCNVIMRVLKDL